MKPRSPIVFLAWAPLGFTLLAAAALLLALAITRALPNGEIVQVISQLAGALLFVAIGGLVAARRPQHPIGWILIGIGLGQAIEVMSAAWTVFGGAQQPPLPGSHLSTWVGTWSWIPSIGLFATFLLLLFPTGRPPSRRWLPIAWLSGAGIAVAAGGVAWTTWPMRDTLDPAGDVPFGAIASVGVIMLGVGAVASVASLVVRFRRSESDERQQLRWFVAAGILAFVGLMLSLVISADWSIWFFLPGFLAIPITAAIAILKYRLYDFDLVVKKTLVLSLLALFIVGLYVVVIAIAAVSGLGAAVAAVILAITFQTVRKWARRVADRVVYGKRATPYEVLTEFSNQLSGEVATEDVAPRMAELLATATGAEIARVWLRIGAELRPQASWPASAGTGAGAPPGLPLSNGELPEFPTGETAVGVEDGGDLLGALSVEMPANDPINPERERLVRDLASQAGLVLRNVRLIEELRASRQRLVAAQDEERRKIERNLHDGAQQQLIALAIKVNLAQTMAPKDAEKTAELLAGVKQELQDSVATLRDLARGIYPPLLADQGLVAALEAQARKAAVPTTVESDGINRYPREVEAAVYFCTLEALQNVAKYAGASQATVSLTADDGALTFTVRDDGAGFDARATTYGTGMQGMADRLDAIGGTLDVESESGDGTSVTGRIPV